MDFNFYTRDILDTIQHAVRVTEVEGKEKGIKGKEKLEHCIELVKFMLPKFSAEISLIEKLIEGTLAVMKIMGDIAGGKD